MSEKRVIKTSMRVKDAEIIMENSEPERMTEEVGSVGENVAVDIVREDDSCSKKTAR